MGKLIKLSSIEKNPTQHRIPLRGTNGWIKTVLETKRNLTKLNVNNLTENGIDFNIVYSKKVDHLFNIGETCTMRFYLSNNQYIPVEFKVSHFKPSTVPGKTPQYTIGGKFNKATPNYHKFLNLIQFLWESPELIIKDRKKAS